MKARFTLNRSGTFSTNQTRKNQCKAPGHYDYDYFIRAVCGSKLDNNGFVIDHLKVHQTVLLATSRIDSCENLCLNVEAALRKLMKEHNVKLYHLYIRIRPRTGSTLNYAFMEYDVEYTKALKHSL